MKTEIEVNQMKVDIEKKISDLQDREIDCCTQADHMRISDQKMQLRAQYNILLEVLK